MCVCDENPKRNMRREEKNLKGGAKEEKKKGKWNMYDLKAEEGRGLGRKRTNKMGGGMKDSAGGGQIRTKCSDLDL